MIPRPSIWKSKTAWTTIANVAFMVAQNLVNPGSDIKLPPNVTAVIGTALGALTIIFRSMQSQDLRRD